MRSLSLLIPLLIPLSAASAFQGMPPVTQIGTLHGIAAKEFVAVPNSGRIYVSDYADGKGGDIWVYDRSSQRTTKVAHIPMSNLAVSPKGDRLAYARDGEDGKQEFVWSMPLDPKTGLSAGPARRVSTTPGYRPSFSPDGKTIAFVAEDDVNEKEILTVVPVTGGRERKLFESSKWIKPVHWSQDSKWIYFGNGGTPPSVKRVPSEGGPVQVVMSDTSLINFEFLRTSGDGRMLAIGSGRMNQNISLMDVAGKPIESFVLPRPMTRTNIWTGPTTLLSFAPDSSSAIVYLSLSDGQKHRLNDATGPAFAPAVSPDGRRVAWIQAAGNKTSLVVIGTDGSGRRVLPLRHAYVKLNDLDRRYYWSPDSRSIAYVGETDNASLSTIDVASAQERELATGIRISNVKWMKDSRRLAYTGKVDSTATGLTLALHLVSADGSGDHNIRTLPTVCPACVWMIGDSVVIYGHDALTTVVSLTPGATPHLLFPNVTGGSGRSAPAISPDGRWLAFRYNDSVEVMKVDGTERRRLVISGQPVWRSKALIGDGSHNGEPQFTPDSRALLLIDRLGDGAGTQTGIDIRRMTLATGEVKKLATLDGLLTSTMRDFSFSADGTSLVYAMDGEPTIHLSELNLAGFLAKTGTPKR